MNIVYLKKIVQCSEYINKLNVRLVIQKSTVFFFALPRLQLYAALDLFLVDLASAVPVIRILVLEELLHL